MRQTDRQTNEQIDGATDRQKMDCETDRQTIILYLGSWKIRALNDTKYPMCVTLE